MSPLEIAETQIGVRETSGQNDGEPSQRYMDGERLPWCAGFVRWCFESAGIPLPGNRWKIRAVTEMQAQLNLMGCGVAYDQVQPGDIVFFTRANTHAGSTGHVGIVESVNHSRGVFSTIEGNLANAVGRATHYFKARDVAGFARWDGSKAHDRLPAR
jgi:hypothetical protein